MGKYICNRILRSVITLFVVATVVFLMLRLMPEEGYFEEGFDKMDEAQICAARADISRFHQRWAKLISCYKESLEIAKSNNLKSIAFPLISSGVYGYPKDKAVKVAIDTIEDFLLENDMLIYLVIFGDTLFNEIKSHMDEKYF